MKAKIISPEHQCYILENYLRKPKKTIANDIGMGLWVVKSFYKKHQLKVPIELVKKWQLEHLYKPFTEDDDDFIRLHIETKSIKAIALLMKRSSCTLQKHVHTIGLTAIIEEKKRKSLFPKGFVPVNKGLKQTDYMSPEMIERTKATRFQKGHIPANSRAVGYEVVRTHKNRKEKYVFVKAAPGEKMQKKHHLTWEKFHGEKVPKGFNVIFIDGDSLNCDDIRNLRLVSDEELLLINQSKPTALIKRWMKVKDTETAQAIANAHPEIVDIIPKMLNLNKQIKNGRSRVN